MYLYEVIFSDKPVVSELNVSPTSVYLGDNVTFTCLIDDLGNPKAVFFTFHQNENVSITTKKPEWIIASYNIHDNDVFSCSAFGVNRNILIESDISEKKTIEVKG